MAPPALHLRENTSRRQGRRHDPLGKTIGGLDQQETGLNTTRTHTCSFTRRAELPLVVFAPRLYVKQRHSLAKPTQHLYSDSKLVQAVLY